MRDLIRQKIIDSLAAPVPALTRRDVRVPGVPNKAIAVIGPRRAGKTTFLWQTIADRLAAGSPRESLLYFNFEDERLAAMQAGDLQLVLEEYFSLYPAFRGNTRVTMLLDEIQNVPGWEKFARRILDSEQVELYLSGSSARLLSRDIATSMRGRAMEALVFPFSFREFLRHRGEEPDRPYDRLTSASRSTIHGSLREYLVCGGYPEAQGIGEQDRIDLLRTYIESALFRDVVERHSVSNPTALGWLVRHLLANAAGLFSVQKFYGDLRSQGIAVSKDTLHEYLSHLEDAFLIRTVAIAGGSERKRMVNLRKAYPIDSGLIPVYDRSGKTNLGHMLETCVALELERRGMGVAYARTPSGYEVDLVASHANGQQELIQVCADLNSNETLDREARALAEAAEQFPRASTTLLGIGIEGLRPQPDGIRTVEAAQWLLE